jgi:hypothetical protein
MTNGTSQSAPGPDWYADPSTPGQLRFWDGAAWTAHVKPVAPASATVQYSAQPAPKTLANRAAGFGMVGVLLIGVGILLAIFAGQTPLTVALILGGAIVFVASLVFCVVFTVLKR